VLVEETEMMAMKSQ